MSKFTTDRTYPREWWSVDRSGAVTEGVFIAESEHRLSYIHHKGLTRFLNKSSRYETWYPTLEEAKAASAEIKARKAAQEADKRVRDAAPELLAALEGLIPCVGSPVALPDTAERVRAAVAAIARAEGGAA